MALFHFSVTQVRRSAGQSVVASAAYRAGEKLSNSYYGEVSDYTKKGGVILSEILLPPHAPAEYSDRETLWNAVEKAERGKNAQLAYSFDIALQNEFTPDENIELARSFLKEHFVSRGMTADFAVHEPDKGKGGMNNPHFHVLCPIRPLNPDGSWGLKQRRVYALSEDGDRLKDERGNYIFNAVPTTDWGSPETLEYWRETWARMCNEKFAEKGLDTRIDHRSFVRRGSEMIPTIHEGPKVRAMEKKGIRTDKGDINRMVKAANALIRDIKEKIKSLTEWIASMREELKKEEPDLIYLLSDYLSMRNEGARSRKGKAANLKEMSGTVSFLKEKSIFTLDDLEEHVNDCRERVSALKREMDAQTGRMKEIGKIFDAAGTYKKYKSVQDELSWIKFKTPREKYKAQHEYELKQFYAARRILTKEFPEGKVPEGRLSAEYETLEKKHKETYAELRKVREDFNKLLKVRHHALTASKDTDRGAKTKRKEAER